MTLRISRSFFASAALAVVAAGASAQDMTGAGATFPAPIYAKWADAYNKATGARVNYQSVGSGAGLNQIRAKTVDFGASDMPLTDEALAKDALLQFPTVLGDIFLGKVSKWNDAAIAALNPGVSLLDAAIAVVRRADGSGTTVICSDY